MSGKSKFSIRTGISVVLYKTMRELLLIVAFLFGSLNMIKELLVIVFRSLSSNILILIEL